MNATIEKSEFKIISDSLPEIANPLLNKIINRNVKSKENITQNNTYFSYHKKTEEYINIPIYKEDHYKPTSSFEVIQEWEGYVQDIDEDGKIFTATLLDITAHKAYPSEEADFKLEDVDNFDLLFLRIGAVFRWVIGYELERKEKNGRVSVTKISSSNLVFRRMLQWNETSLKQADKKAKEFKDEIIWE